jgi:FkbM family methyltransferase
VKKPFRGVGAMLRRVAKRILPKSVTDYLRARIQRAEIAKAMASAEGLEEAFWHMDRGFRTVLDIGANIGDVTLSMLGHFPDATVYAFEPCSDTYAVLEDRVSSSPHGSRVKLFRHGFFDEVTTGQLHVTSFSGANSLLEITPEYHAANPHIEDRGVETIELMRLDDFVRQQGIEHIDLVKIDVEGAEEQVLAGGRETLTSMVDFVVCEVSLVRRPFADAGHLRIMQLMHECGFAPVRIYDVAQGITGDTWLLSQFDCIFRRVSR